MDFSFWHSTEVNLATTAFRLVLSLVLGGMLGYERETRKQHVGFRTLMVISVGSCLLMLISIYVPQTFTQYRNVDPGRIAAQVVSGIGFLGAGAIFRLGANTHGLTTAAAIWAVAAVGLAVGIGMYDAAIIGTLLLLFVLSVLDKVSKKIFMGGSLKNLRISFQSAKIETTKVFVVLEKFKITVKNVNVEQSSQDQKSQIQLYVFVPDDLHLKEFYKELNELKNVGQISLSQDF